MHFQFKNTDEKFGWTQMVETLTYLLDEKNRKYKKMKCTYC